MMSLQRKLSWLELKIPPVPLVVIFMLLIRLISSWTPGIQISSQSRFITIATFIVLGFLCAFSGVLSFNRAKTTVNPLAPDKSSSLVTSGIYRYTRNPMYVGFLFFLMGFGVYLSNLYALASTTLFVVYMNKFQIRPEERALEAIFGAEFIAYKNKVRRWL